MFGLWDRSGRDPHMLVTLWATFHYDMDFLDDITLCCQLLDFQRKTQEVSEVYGL